MTTTTPTYARHDSLTAYLGMFGIFADGCQWHDFPTATAAVTGNGVAAIASDFSNEGAVREADYRSAVAILTACGITQFSEVAYDNANGVEVFLFGR